MKVLLPSGIIFFLLAGIFLPVSTSLYGPGFNGPLIYDSERLERATQNGTQPSPSDFVRIFPQRPVAMFSFYVSYLLHGLNPSSLRIDNAVLLALTALVLVALLFAVLEIPTAHILGTASEKKWVAAAAGLIFLIHPLQTYLVLYVWQRQALLACLFYFSALAVYVRTRTGVLPHTTLGYIAVFGLFLFGVLSKENAITLPLALVLLEITVLREEPRNGWKIFLFAGFLIASAAATLALLERPHGVQVTASGIWETVTVYYRESGLSIMAVLSAFFRTTISHLIAVLLPLPGNVKFVDAEIISESLVDPPSTLAALIALALLVVLALWMRRRRPLVSFGILFFLLNLLPESLLVPQYLFFGYRAVLPMAGVLAVGAAGFLELLPHLKRALPGKRAPVAGCVVFLVIAVGLMSVTYAKAIPWSSCDLIWHEFLKALPVFEPRLQKPPYVHSLVNLGQCLESSGRTAEAVQAYQKALEIAPEQASVLVALGKAHVALGNLDDAESYFKKAIEVPRHSNTETFWAHFSYALFLDNARRYKEALFHYGEALKTGEQPEKIYHNLGLIMLEQGRLVDAVDYFGKALERQPHFGPPHQALAKVQFGLGNYADAMKHCVAAARAGSPCNPQALEKAIHAQSTK
ncbi:MAG: tetratricopeptide repeat protein [Desulfomonilaceae bacterium]